MDSEWAAGKADLPAGFVREYDAILLAVPFSLSGAGAPLTSAHHARLEHALERRFVRSLRVVNGGLEEALEQSCTGELAYRVTSAETVSLAHDTEAVLLTCSPQAHLALANLLERDAVFTVELFGRVVRKN